MEQMTEQPPSEDQKRITLLERELRGITAQRDAINRLYAVLARKFEALMIPAPPR